MNKLWKFVLIFSTLIIILACNLPSEAPTPTSQPNVATIVANSLQAATDAAGTSAAQITSTPTITPTATASPTPQALAVSYGNVQLAIPSNLASGTTNVTTTDIEPPYINPSAG